LPHDRLLWQGPCRTKEQIVRVHVDPERCQGHARCAALAPDVFELDENGFSTTRDQPVAADLQVDAGKAARSCPEDAISVTDVAPAVSA
jgi:ferredoxin